MLRVRRHAWAMLALLAVFASQFVFYFGQWPIGAVPRYLFPGILAQHLAIFLFVVVIAEIFAARPSRSRRHAWILYLIAALYFVKPSVTDLGANRAASRQTVATTIAFTGRLNESVTYLKAHPAAALILNSNNVIDYEPVYSIERFVRASGVRNPIALHLNGYSAGSYSDTGSTKLSFMLATALEQIQLEGDGKFVPLRSTITFPECFSIGLSGAALARCQAGITISP